MIHRRRFLLVAPAALVSATPLVAFACSSPPAEAQAVPGDRPVCARTGPDIEGPFFVPGAPLSTRLARTSERGEPLNLRLRVRSMLCEPVQGAVVELWQADASGAYDQEGFQFRTRLVTDGEGICRVQTIVPGRYLNGARYRPAHIHAKVTVPGRRILTTQLYFHGDPENEMDPWFHASRLIRIERGLGDFGFVV